MQKLYSIKFNYKEHLLIDALEVLFVGIAFYVSYLILKEVASLNRWSVSYDLVVLFFIISLMSIQMIITYTKEKLYSYDFHADRIVFNGSMPRQLYYSDINYMEIKRPFLDQFFDTFTLVINRKWKMKGLHHPQAIYDYIQKLRQYNAQKQP